MKNNKDSKSNNNNTSSNDNNKSLSNDNSESIRQNGQFWLFLARICPKMDFEVRILKISWLGISTSEIPYAPILRQKTQLWILI